MLNCKEIFGRNYFDSYSEFYLALCFAAEMGRRGDKLDMSEMVVDRSAVSDDELFYFKYLISTGCAYLGEGQESSLAKGIDPRNLLYYLDMSGITTLKDVLVDDRPEEYYWSMKWSEEHYGAGPWEYKLVRNTGNVLMHVVAYIIISEILGDIPKKPMHIQFVSLDVLNTQHYANIASCCKTLPWFKDMVFLDIDLENTTVDVAYSIFCNNSRAAGRFKEWTISDKHKFLKEYNIVDGSIVELWERSGICASSPYGKISSVRVARVDEIGKDFLGLTTVALNKTKEEMRLDYESIAESVRYLFRDLLTSKPLVRPTVLPLYEVGIGNYFYDETSFITPIDKNSMVSKRVTIDGKEGDVEMSNVDALYWLMCQHGFEFDRELFRMQYAEGKELLWDKYGLDASDF